MASKSPSKSDLIASIANTTGADKKVVKAVLEALPGEVVAALKLVGEFTLPGVAKLKAKSTPATADRPGVNPFTKQPQTIKGKSASLKVRLTAVKTLKVAVAG